MTAFFAKRAINAYGRQEALYFGLVKLVVDVVGFDLLNNGTVPAEFTGWCGKILFGP